MPLPICFVLNMRCAAGWNGRGLIKYRSLWSLIPTYPVHTVKISSPAKALKFWLPFHLIVEAARRLAEMLDAGSHIKAKFGASEQEQIYRHLVRIIKKAG